VVFPRAVSVASACSAKTVSGKGIAETARQLHTRVIGRAYAVAVHVPPRRSNGPSPRSRRMKNDGRPRFFRRQVGWRRSHETSNRTVQIRGRRRRHGRAPKRQEFCLPATMSPPAFSFPLINAITPYAIRRYQIEIEAPGTPVQCRYARQTPSSLRMNAEAPYRILLKSPRGEEGMVETRCCSSMSACPPPW